MHNSVEELSVDFVFKEYNDGVTSEAAAADSDLARRMAEFEKMKESWEKEQNARTAEAAAAKAAGGGGGAEAGPVSPTESKAAAALASREEALKQEMLHAAMKELIPKLSEAKVLCEALQRGFLSLKVGLVPLSTLYDLTSAHIMFLLLSHRYSLSWGRRRMK